MDIHKIDQYIKDIVYKDFRELLDLKNINYDSDHNVRAFFGKGKELSTNIEISSNLYCLNKEKCDNDFNKFCAYYVIGLSMKEYYGLEKMNIFRYIENITSNDMKIIIKKNFSNENKKDFYLAVGKKYKNIYIYREDEGGRLFFEGDDTKKFYVIENLYYLIKDEESDKEKS